MFGKASPEIESLRASATNGQKWFEGGVEEGARRVSLTVMIDVGDGNYTGFDVYFNVDEEPFATYEWSISDSEAISPGSISPVHGWVGWQDSDVAVAWQWSELGEQGVEQWPGRSPFSEKGDEDSSPDVEGFARLAAALVLMHYEGDALSRYLPKRESE